MGGQMDIFYNTTGEKGESLSQAIESAKCQNQKVLEIFKRHGRTGLTPAEAHRFLPQYPLTSVRRSIHTLTDNGELWKTEQKRKGIYGRLNFVWKLREQS